MRSSLLLPLLLLLLLAALGAWLLLDPPGGPAVPAEPAALPAAREAEAAPVPPAAATRPIPERQPMARGLQVRVLDPARNEPVAARLLLQEGHEEPRWLEAPDGLLEIPRSGERLQILALASGAWSRFRVLDAERRATTEVLDLHPADRTATLDIRVRGPGGGPAAFRWRLSPVASQVPADPDSLSRARYWARAAGDGQAADGRARVRDLPPATWSLRLESEVAPPLVRTVALPAGAREVLTLDLAPGGFVEGLVGRDDGSRVADARVFLLPADLGVIGSILDGLRRERRLSFLEETAVPGGQGRTGPDGAWHIGPVAPGEYRVHAVAPGLLPAALAEPVTVLAGETVRVRALVLQPGRSLQVRVLRAEDAEPLAGARVLFHSGRPEDSPLTRVLGWEEPPEPETGADGTVTLPDLAPGAVTLQVAAEGRGTVEEVVQVPAQGEVPVAEVLLAPALGIRGRVLDLATRQPVAAARVRPRPAGGEGFLASFMPRQAADPLEIETGEDGSFALTGLTAGTWELEVTEDAHAPGQAGPFELAPGLPPPEAEILLGQGAELLVRVLDQEGQPAANRVVSAFAPQAGYTEGGSTDARGEVRFLHLTPGTWVVNAVNSPLLKPSGQALQGDLLAGLEMESETVVLEEGERAELVLGGPREWGSLFGFVTRGGTPVPGVQVLLSQGMRFRSTRTDDSGLYEFEEVPPGDSMLLAGRFQLGGGAGYTTVVHVPAGSEVQRDVELPDTDLRVRVLDEADGRPVAGVPVVLRPRQSNQGGGMLTTDGRGEVRFTWVVPGDYVLVAGRAALPLFGRDEHAAVVVDPLHLQEGVGEQLVELRVGQGARLRATVLDPAGQPVADASVFLLTPAGQPVTLMSMSGTAGDGSLVLEGLPAGPHRALARHPRLGTIEAPVLLQAGETTEVTLQLEPGTILAVLPVDAEGRPLKGVQAVALDARGAPVSILAGASQAMDQAFAFLSGRPQELGPLAPGHYVILLQAPGGPASRHPVEVPAGGGRMELPLRHDP